MPPNHESPTVLAMKKVLLALITSFVFIPFLLAQNSDEETKTLEDFSRIDKEAFFDHVVVQSDLEKALRKELKNGEVSIDDIRPKRIGLVSTYLYEEKFTKSQAMVLYIYEQDGGPNYFYDRIAGPAIDGLVKAFADSEVELLLPEDYLKTAEDRERYEKLGKKLSFSDPFSSAVKAKGGDPAGGRFQFIYSMFKMGYSDKVWNELADFAVAMDLDAVLTLEIVTEYFDKSINLGKINLMLHGANKLEKEGNRGLLYNIYTFYPDYMYPLAEIKGLKLGQEAYEGLGKIHERIGRDYIEYLDESLEEVFAPY